MSENMKKNGEAVDFSEKVLVISEMGDIPDTPWPIIERWIPLKTGSSERSCVGTLATVDSTNFVSSRSMNVKFCKNEILLATHRESKKWRGDRNEQFASWHVYWPKQRRQLDIRGKLIEGADSLAEEWWNKRPAQMDLVSTLSRQSQIASHIELENIRQLVCDDNDKDFAQKKLSRPESFIVLRLIPLEIEFWEGKFDRVHNRYLFKYDEKTEWKKSVLFP